MAVIAFLVLFGLVVFSHEFGHFIVAKLARVRVEEFGFGYPPRLFSLGTWKGTEYTINALPIGGFVKMGEEDDSHPDSMANKPWYIRASAYLAGPLMNIVLALVLYMMVAMFGQQSVTGTIVIDQVAPGSPAQVAGLLTGDQVLAINGTTVNNTLELSQQTQLAAGTEVKLLIDRNGEQLTVTLVPRVHPPAGEGAMGIRIGMQNIQTETLRYPIWQAIPQAIHSTGNTLKLIVASFVGMIRGSVAPDLIGPVGLVQVTGEVAKAGWVNLLDLGGLLCINLFILNLLPIPPLDGFRIFLILIEVVRGGRRIQVKTESAVNAIGMVLLLAFMLLVTVKDVIRFASGQSFLP